jgi:transposase-like protein
LVDRKEAYLESGKLVCPKCHSKLELLGSDYRMLSSMYLCQDCKTMHSELLLTSICQVCSTELDLEEQDEVALLAYRLSSQAQREALEIAKPIESCVKYFERLGYKVELPGVIAGKSGAEHRFDLRVVSGDGASEMAFDTIIGEGEVGVEDLEKEAGKAHDVACDVLVFVVPALSAQAKIFSRSVPFRMVVGPSLVEALEMTEVAVESVQEA